MADSSRQSPGQEPAPERGTDFRWQAFFQRATEPLFVLNRRRRLVFANRAWEALTGLRLADVRGQASRRRRDASQERDEAALALLAPPAEALEGQPAQAHRRPPWAGGAAWWQIDFFPLPGADGVL